MPAGLLGDLRVFHQNRVSVPQVWNSPLFSKDPGARGKSLRAPCADALGPCPVHIRAARRKASGTLGLHRYASPSPALCQRVPRHQEHRRQSRLLWLVVLWLLFAQIKDITNKLLIGAFFERFRGVSQVVE